MDIRSRNSETVPNKDKTQNPNKDKIKQFYYRSDIVYTMPGKGDEMTVWYEVGKQKL